MPNSTYETLIDPATSDILGASQLNLLVRNTLYLHGLAAGGYEPFSGFSGAGGIGGTQEIWNGWWVYGGIKKLYNDFTDDTGAGITVTVQTDGVDLTFTTPFANPLDLSGGLFTLGNKYYVTLKSTSFATGHVYFAYAPQPQSGTWATPTTFTDANTSAAADFTNLSADMSYLRQILEVPRGTFRGTTGTTPGGGTWITFWVGSFVYKGLNTLNITAGITAPNGTTTVELHIVDTGGANDRTCLTTTSGMLTATYDLSTASPALTLGNRYRIYVRAKTDEASTFASVVCSRIFISGSKALTNNPALWSVRDYLLASSGANRLSYIAAALTSIRAIAEYDTITSVDYGRGYVSAGNDSGANMTFADFRRVRRWRWLKYLPTAASATGTLTYGTTGSTTLSDVNSDGAWNTLDLETLPLLPPGFTFKVPGGNSCVESPTSS